MSAPAASELLEATRRARQLGYRFEMFRIEFVNGDKVVVNPPPKRWQTLPQVDDSYVQQRIRAGCNAYLIHCELSGVTLHDADTPEEIARIQALYPGRAADVVTRKGRHWYARGYVPGAFAKNWHMAYGPGSFYTLPDGGLQVYRGSLPALDRLPPTVAPADAPATNGHRPDAAPREVPRSVAAREYDVAYDRLVADVRRWARDGWGGDAHAGLLRHSTHLARLAPFQAADAYIAAFREAGAEPDEDDLAKMEQALAKSTPDTVVDDPTDPQGRFFAGLDPVAPTLTPNGANLPAGFWAARPVLRHVRQAAHARACSADAVFGVVLALLAAHVPGELRVDTGVRAPMPLSTFAVLLGHSGAGKSSSATVAAELFPHLRASPEGSPLGSGEGLCDAFMETREVAGPNGKPAHVYEQARHNAYFHADEGGRVLDLKARSGSTLLATLRDAWSGGTFGQRNTVAGGRSRKIERATLGLWIGLQQPHAARLLADESATDGTIQRFVWFSATDPSVPEEAEPWPGPLVLPLLGSGIALPAISAITLDPGIRTELRRSQVARARGELIAAPGREQDDALRVRLGALLALLDGRTHVDLEDWRLAAVVLGMSATAVAAVRAGMRATAVDRGVGRAELDDAVSDVITEKVLHKIVNRLKTRSDGEARSTVAKAVSRRRPEEFDAALQLGVDRGLLKIENDPQRGDKLHAL